MLSDGCSCVTAEGETPEGETFRLQNSNGVFTPPNRAGETSKYQAGNMNSVKSVPLTGLSLPWIGAEAKRPQSLMTQNWKMKTQWFKSQQDRACHI